MVPESVFTRLLCGDCLRLYCMLDEQQRATGRPVRGAGPIAERLSWQTKTVRKHVRHLLAAGLVLCDPPPIDNHGWSTIKMYVLHNPARGRVVATTMTPEWVDEPVQRWNNPRSLSKR
jgi:hypothetical protein